MFCIAFKWLGEFIRRERQIHDELYYTDLRIPNEKSLFCILAFTALVPYRTSVIKDAFI